MKDLASGVLVGNISNSDTTMTVKVGSGDSLTTAAVWPSVPFYATIMPANPIAGASNSLDSEIVKVTNLTGGNGQVTMTISRGARGTTTKEFSDGAIVTNGIYADDAVFLDDLVSEVEEPTPWIESSDIVDGAVTNAKLGSAAVKSGNIDWGTVINKIYPVGSIYMSVVNTSPNYFIGGTWVSWGTGRVPVGVDAGASEFNAVEKTGGTKTHTLTANEIPDHSHNDRQLGSFSGGAVGYEGKTGSLVNNNATYGMNGRTSSTTSAHNNLQPYITCYMWKRTA